VHYRDHWFWIDDSDWQTKRALTAVMEPAALRSCP
jgi:hypothetical protein